MAGDIFRVDRADGSMFSFAMTARLDTPVEVDYYRNDGILPAVLRGLLSLDLDVSGIEVTSAGLEDAFLALTRKDA